MWVARRRIVVFGGLYWGRPILGDHHRVMLLTAQRHPLLRVARLEMEFPKYIAAE